MHMGFERQRLNSLCLFCYNISNYAYTANAGGRMRKKYDLRQFNGIA